MEVIGVIGSRNNYGTHPGYIVTMDADEMDWICRENARSVISGSKLHIRDEVLRLKLLDQKRREFKDLARQLRAHADLLDSEQVTVENLMNETKPGAEDIDVDI